VAALARELHAAWPRFPRDRFLAEATDGLETHELKARAGLIGDALVGALPCDLSSLEKLVEAHQSSRAG